MEQKMRLFHIPKDLKSLKGLYRRIKRDFPPNERIPYILFRRAFYKKGTIRAVSLSGGSACHGYIVYAGLPGSRLTNVIYFAIEPALRSSGLGTLFLSMFSDSIAPEGIILEAEDPAAAKSADERAARLRRIAFYRKNGFYTIPGLVLDFFGVSSLIMANVETDIRDWKRLYMELYSDIFGLRLPARFLSKGD